MSEKILISDDDAFVLKTFKLTLTEEQCKNIDFCESPEQALELMNKNEYKRVISDWRFPDSELTGLDVLTKAFDNGIKERVLMTSVSKIKHIDEAHAFCGIRKPLSKGNIIKICFDEYDNLNKMDSYIK